MYLALTPKFTKNTKRKNETIFLKVIVVVINIYLAQIPCEYDQMRVTNKYDAN